MLRSCVLLLAVGLNVRAVAQCQSYGYDFVDGGSYFQNISSSDDFTFISYFEGCDGQGSITPILVDPNEDEYFCSDIATSPDDALFNSTCPISKSEMFSGTWYLVIEGPDFAFTRTFYLTVDVPTTIIATPTDVFGYTITPNATTVMSNITETCSTTLPVSTTTVPCKTYVKLATTTPKQVTVYSTKTITQTRIGRIWTTSTSTVIYSTASCTAPPYPPKQDQKILGRFTPKSSSTGRVRRFPLVERTPDEATTTVTETTYTFNTTKTVTLPTPVVTEIAIVTTTSTITPTPCTVCEGITVQKSIITAPTPTRTRTTRTWVTFWTTKTISVVRTKMSVVIPTGKAATCTKRGGHM